MGKNYFKMLRFPWYKWIILIAIPILLISLLITKLDSIRTEDIPQVVEIMVGIYEKLSQNIDSQNGGIQLTHKDKKYVRKHLIDWDRNVFPILVDKEKMKEKYYPYDHVVVYSRPILTAKNERIGMFLNGQGNVRNVESEVCLNNLISVTRYGTLNIIKGEVSDKKDISKEYNIEKNPQLYEYLLLKNLILKRDNFHKYVLLAAETKEASINKWLKTILENAIVSPALPNLPLSYGKEEEFYKNLSEWYRENNDQIKYTNEFLF